MLLAAILALALQSTPAFDENTPTAELTTLAEGGNIEAQSELGLRLQLEWLNNGGDPQDESGLILLEQARYWLERAAEADDAMALNSLGTMYNQGMGVEYDPVRAESLFRRAIAAGDLAAVVNLASIQIYDDDPSNNQEAVDSLEALLATGNAAQLELVASGFLGLAYTFAGGDVVQDYERGLELLEYADSTGEANPGVLFMLGRYHETGAGGADGGEAVSLEYFERAGRNGNGFAAWKAGMQHLNGWGTEVNQPEAFRWVRMAAELGDDQGMISTAVMYALGQGTDIDYGQSRYWYEQAASLGNVHAMRAIGMMDVIGQGGPVDLPRGVALLEMAASHGDRNAIMLLEQFDQPETPEFRESVRAAGEAWMSRHGLTDADLYGGQE